MGEINPHTGERLPVTITGTGTLRVGELQAVNHP